MGVIAEQNGRDSEMLKDEKYTFLFINVVYCWYTKSHDHVMYVCIMSSILHTPPKRCDYRITGDRLMEPPSGQAKSFTWVAYPQLYVFVPLRY